MNLNHIGETPIELKKQTNLEKVLKQKEGYSFSDYEDDSLMDEFGKFVDKHNGKVAMEEKSDKIKPKKAAFESFLDKLETESNRDLLEAVRDGFSAIYK